MKKIAVLLAALLIVACSSTPKTETPKKEIAQPTKVNEKVNTAAPTPVIVPVVVATEVAADSLPAELQELQKLNAYFDLDKSDVKPEDHAAIQKQASFIMVHKNDIVTLEGNCDERGSDKYNMTLGHKRANAVEKALHSLGVPPAQIKTVSYGKEKPHMLCHEEKCWKENRRVDFVHSIK